MIRLVCIDVDGTLVGSSGVVHEEVWRAAARARAAGLRLAIASGRPAFGVSRAYAERLDAAGWHCFQNGASIVDLATSRSRSTPLAPESVRRLVAWSRRGGLDLELYTDDDYAVESRSARARGHAALLGVPFVPRPLESIDGVIVRAQWLLSHDEAPRVLAEPHPGIEVSPSTSPVMPDTHFVNLTPAGVDKASAVRTIAAAYDVRLEEVMYVGDGINDVVAMRIVGHPVAMANAEPAARAAARRTVGQVDAGGLAEALDYAAGVTG